MRSLNKNRKLSLRGWKYVKGGGGKKKSSKKSKKPKKSKKSKAIAAAAVISAALAGTYLMQQKKGKSTPSTPPKKTKTLTREEKELQEAQIAKEETEFNAVANYCIFKTNRQLNNGPKSFNEGGNPIPGVNNKIVSYMLVVPHKKKIKMDTFVILFKYRLGCDIPDVSTIPSTINAKVYSNVTYEDTYYFKEATDLKIDDKVQFCVQTRYQGVWSQPEDCKIYTYTVTHIKGEDITLENNDYAKL